jgi:hypothetical protein
MAKTDGCPARTTSQAAVAFRVLLRRNLDFGREVHLLGHGRGPIGQAVVRDQRVQRNLSPAEIYAREVSPARSGSQRGAQAAAGHRAILVRERVKERTGRDRDGVKEVRVLIRELNPILRGWGAKRTGESNRRRPPAGDNGSVSARSRVHVRSRVHASQTRRSPASGGISAATDRGATQGGRGSDRPGPPARLPCRRGPSRGRALRDHPRRLARAARAALSLILPSAAQDRCASRDRSGTPP